MTYDELLGLAKELALCLADEVAFAGIDAAERSLVVLKKAGEKLGIQKEFEEIDTLSS